MVLTTSTVPGVTIFLNGCHVWLPKAVLGYDFKVIDIESLTIGHKFANNCDIIMISGSKYMFMDMRNSFKIVLTTSRVPGFTIYQNGYQIWLQNPF